MSSPSSSSYMLGLSFRNCILLGVLFQNAGYTLLRKYSTMTENVSSKEILLMSEFIKISFATYMIVNSNEVSDSQGKGIDKLKWLLRNSSKMLVLAGIYGAMNILSFVALNYIGAGEFTICAQLKILSTAFMSVYILKTSLSNTKWRALFLLVLGCLLVVSPNFTSETKGRTSDLFIELVFGYGSVLTEVALSGFASIYFEKVVKSTTENITIWERNFQLGFYSLIMYGLIILYESFDQVSIRSKPPLFNMSIYFNQL